MVGGLLLLGGAVLVVVGSFLTWFSFGDIDVNGFTEFGNRAADEETRDGPVFVTLAVILAGFGITTLAAKRLLPIAILAVIFASLSVIAGLVDYADIQDAQDVFGVEPGPGLPVILLGSLVALAGGIVTLATRRR